MSMSMTITLHETTCAICGVAFALPLNLVLARKKGNGPVYCPNRHRNHFWNQKDIDPEVIESRRRKVRRIHEREQREAREADKVETNTGNK